MSIKTNHWVARLARVGVLAVVYFVLFPQDLVSLINPLEELLRLSQVVSPGLYALIGIALVCWTMDRIWGRRAPFHTDSDVPPT